MLSFSCLYHCGSGGLHLFTSPSNGLLLLLPHCQAGSGGWWGLLSCPVPGLVLDSSCASWPSLMIGDLSFYWYGILVPGQFSCFPWDKGFLLLSFPKPQWGLPMPHGWHVCCSFLLKFTVFAPHERRFAHFPQLHLLLCASHGDLLSLVSLPVFCVSTC